jgi:HPt (histidine-containing phosphotransfer) domain-containing protein
MNNNGQNSPDGTSTPDSLYDLTMVRAVSGGDESFIKKMVLLFVETVPPSVKDMQAAVATEEWEQVGKLAHKLKSTVDSMGIISLKDDIRSLENYGKNRLELAAIPGLAQRVTEKIEAVIKQLNTDFAL